MQGFCKKKFVQCMYELILTTLTVNFLNKYYIIRYEANPDILHNDFVLL